MIRAMQNTPHLFGANECGVFFYLHTLKKALPAFHGSAFAVWLHYTRCIKSP